MNRLFKIVFVSMAGLSFSCGHKPIKKNLTFMDSLAADSSLTEQQLKQHTVLPKDYYQNTSHYEGDTVYYPGSKYPVAIVTSDYHGVCEYSYLLVFDGKTLKNTDFKKVKTSCDSDVDEPYMELDFAVINDSLFYTKDVYTRRFEDKDDVDSIVAKHFFKIDKNGRIDSLTRDPLPKPEN